MTKDGTLRLTVPSRATAADKPGAAKIVRPRWWHRLRRREPSLAHKLLAAHLDAANPKSALR